MSCFQNSDNCPKREDMSGRLRSLLVRIEAILHTAAIAGRCLTYTELAEALGGYNPRNKWIGVCLGTLQDEDRESGKPLRSALVISKKTGLPSYGFFDYAGVGQGNKQFWFEQLKALGLTTVTVKL